MAADRQLLHKNKVEDFKAWLDACGIRHRPGKGDYEVLQVFRADGCWFKLYRRNHMPEHVTVQGPLVNLVREYIASKKLPQAEAMKISTVAATAQTEQEPPWN